LSHGGHCLSLYAIEMQRLYSMFPGGAAGVALLILRACVCGLLSLCAFDFDSTLSLSWPTIGLASLLLVVAIGAFTPLASALAAVIETFYLVHSNGTGIFLTTLSTLVSLAVALLGPGAFSLDAKLFGRRLIIPGKD
jgi:hypothetical protein